MNTCSSQAVLAAGALAILGGIGAAMLFTPIPAPNAQSVTFILGALAGALTMQGVGHAVPPSPETKDPQP